MPQTTRNAPDWQDVYNVLASIGEEYNHYVEFTTEVRADYVQVIARSYALAGNAGRNPSHQALSRTSIRKVVDMAQVCHTLAYDLWLQHDGGGATAAKRGAPVNWRGRYETLRGRKQ